MPLILNSHRCCWYSLLQYNTSCQTRNNTNSLHIQRAFNTLVSPQVGDIVLLARWEKSQPWAPARITRKIDATYKVDIEWIGDGATVKEFLAHPYAFKEFTLDSVPPKEPGRRCPTPESIKAYDLAKQALRELIPETKGDKEKKEEHAESDEQEEDEEGQDVHQLEEQKPPRSTRSRRAATKPAPAAQPTRKRGRPPKPKAAAESDDVMAAPKRKRGRPRKTKVEAE